MKANIRIGDVCEILNGFAFKSDEYVEDGIRVMRITNVQKGAVVDDEPKYFPAERASEISRFLLREGDLLMSLTGNVGRVGLLPKELLPAALNQRVACLRLKDDGVLMKYLFYILNSDSFETDCIFNASGIAQKNMSTRWLESYDIPIPPISEQERIIAELDLLTSIIDKQKQQLAELDTLAQSIFYDMFKDELTSPATRRLKDIATYRIGLTYKPTDVAETGIIVLRSSNIQDNRLDFKDIVRVNLAVDAKKLVYNGDILMCARNGSARLVGKVARIRDINEEMSFGAFMTTIQSKYNDYLFYFFLSPFFRSQLGSAQTATINQITSKMLDEIKINVPSLEKQSFFAKKIQSLETQKIAINRSIEESQKLFNYTMDKYFG